jgi:hypothetical protein
MRKSGWGTARGMVWDSGRRSGSNAFSEDNVRIGGNSGVVCKQTEENWSALLVGPGSLVCAIEGCTAKCQDSLMRVNLITQPSDRSDSSAGTVPLSLTVRPACGLPGDYEYPTDSKALLRLLRQQTDLSADALQCFEKDLRDSRGARLMGVELSDSVLTDIGYFID